MPNTAQPIIDALKACAEMCGIFNAKLNRTRLFSQRSFGFNKSIFTHNNKTEI